MLQETYSERKTMPKWKLEWGRKSICNNGTKHSKGIMILINPTYDAEIVKVDNDNNGHYIILDIKIDNIHLILINIYASNDSIHQVQFFFTVCNRNWRIMRTNISL